MRELRVQSFQVAKRSTVRVSQRTTRVVSAGMTLYAVRQSCKSASDGRTIGNAHAPSKKDFGPGFVDYVPVTRKDYCDQDLALKLAGGLQTCLSLKCGDAILTSLVVGRAILEDRSLWLILRFRCLDESSGRDLGGPLGKSPRGDLRPRFREAPGSDLLFGCGKLSERNLGHTLSTSNKSIDAGPSGIRRR